MFRIVSIVAASFILASTAFAHEGHGDPSHQHGVTHYAVNPSHAVPIVLTAGVVVGLGLLIVRGVRNRRA